MSDFHDKYCFLIIHLYEVKGNEKILNPKKKGLDLALLLGL